MVNRNLLEVIKNSSRPSLFVFGAVAYAHLSNDLSIRIGDPEDEEECNGLWDSDIISVDSLGITLL